MTENVSGGNTFFHSSSERWTGAAGVSLMAASLKDVAPYLNAPRAGLVVHARHEELRDQRRPSRLMRCPDAAVGIAMKILVEWNAVLVVRIALQLRLMTQHRPLAARVLQENPRQPQGQLGGNLVDGEVGSGPRGTLHFEVIAIIVMKLLQRFDDQEIQGKPNRSAP